MSDKYCPQCTVGYCSYQHMPDSVCPHAKRLMVHKSNNWEVKGEVAVEDSRTRDQKLRDEMSRSDAILKEAKRNGDVCDVLYIDLKSFEVERRGLKFHQLADIRYVPEYYVFDGYLECSSGCVIGEKPPIVYINSDIDATGYENVKGLLIRRTFNYLGWRFDNNLEAGYKQTMFIDKYWDYVKYMENVVNRI